MQIHYLSTLSPAIASVRYRMLIPGLELHKQGHDVNVSEEPPATPVDVLVMAKYHNTELSIKAAHAAQAAGTRVVYDITDDHSQSKLPIWGYYRHILPLVDVVTVPTARMQTVVKEQLGRDAVVIQDPYEFDEVPPRFDPHDPLRLMWYGHPNNFLALAAEKGALRDCHITALTQINQDVDDGRIRLRPWSLENMQEQFDYTDLVVLPVDLHKEKKLSKSTNRMVEAIRQGRFVVASPLPAYQQFGEWMWLGDSMRDGVHWAAAHRDEVLDRIGRAQACVREQFDPARIAEKWMEVFTK